MVCDYLSYDNGEWKFFDVWEGFLLNPNHPYPTKLILTAKFNNMNLMSSTFTTFDMIITQTNPSFSYIYGILPTVLYFQLYWITPPSRQIILTPIMNITSMLTKSTNSKFMKGTMMILTPTFTSIITMNVWGASPFTVTMTSHLMTTLSMGTSSWMTLTIVSLTTKLKLTYAHLLPENSPTFIASFLSMVESLSSSIRPITLSFRLSANISAGHVILGMMTSAGAFTLLATMLLMIIPIIASSSYTLFELAICLVQAFVLTLLASMYSNDYLSPTTTW